MTQTVNYGDRYKGVRVIVVGASGFIGRWVARLLCQQGASICLVVREKAKSETLFRDYGVDGELIEIDLRDAAMVRNLFIRVKPSITFNLAGYGIDQSERDEATAYEINAELPRIISEAVADVKDRQWQGLGMVHVGSALEYGASNGNLSEDSVPRPTCLYGRSKLAGTLALARCCKAHRLKAVTARLFTVYGPGEHQGRLLPSLLQMTRTDNALALTSGEQRRDFTYVEDVAEGLLRLGLATVNSGEVVNLATGCLTTVRNFAETAVGILGPDQAKLEFGKLPTRANEMKHFEVTVERLLQLTAWTAQTNISEGIRKTLSFSRLKGSSNACTHANLQ